MNLSFFYPLSAAALICLNAIPAAAQNSSSSFTSTDDGHGLYSYTFNPPTNLYFTIGQVFVKSYGILGTTQPPGWSPTIDASGNIEWTYLTNQYQPFTNTLTFTVQSSYAVPRLYTDTNFSSPTYQGLALLNAYLDPTYQHKLGASATLRFDYFGPSTNGAPTLSLQTDDTNIVVGWHAAAVGHVLEMSTNLAQTNWTPLTNVVLVGHSNFVTVPMVEGPQYFRTINTNTP